MSSIWTIRRSATDTKLTGLCGGVAHHWGIDPVLVRVGWALLTLSGGIGLVLYVAGWLLIPVDGHDKAPVDDFFGSTGRRWPKEVWIALVVIACITVIALFGSVSPVGVGPALVLAVIWYFGVYRNRTRQTPSGAPDQPAVPLMPASQFNRYPGPPTPFTQAADAWAERIEQARRAEFSPSRPNPSQPHPSQPNPSQPNPSQPTPYVWPAPPPADVRSVVSDPPVRETLLSPEVAERQAFLAHPDPVGLYADPEVGRAPHPVKRTGSRAAKRLRLVALMVLGLVLGGLAVLDGQGVEVTVSGYLAAALLVLGLTLVAATWFGRSRGLIPVGLLLVVALLVTSPIGSADPVNNWQPPPTTYTRVADLPVAGDSRDAGQFRVDLSQLQLTGDTTYKAELGAGQLQVRVPPDVNVVLDYGVEAGVVDAFGTKVDSGTELSKSVSFPTVADPKEPTLTLELNVDLGKLQVQR